ncbi:Major facilitator superfamily multidrug transporter [Erysiphe necator]|uniref:Putative mfs general substrate transporter n=1 Tax=Uncinula necator TaxID=52586 RepID=A0A0B1P028_UNCNE|nr:Major facilitator superfamily multidrug transporter [Erysiphe necator]KHJ30251.1 putative mfs general substrate transporter [Erysiphe necator]
MAPRLQVSVPNLNYFPTTQLFVLAIVRLAEPIALTSIFPYSWELVKRFGVGDEKHASFYSGLLISAFSLAEALTGMFWGSLSDKVGRKPILLCGCAGTILSLLIVGTAQNFWVALAGRALGGILNGNIAVIQTVVGELVTCPQHEPRAYSVMPFVWSLGTIIGPAIGGTFVDPSTSFPHFFSPHGIFARFPYLLSNLICACILMISIITGYIFLEETHPKMRPFCSLTRPSFLPDGISINITSTNLHKNLKVQETRLKTYGTCDSQDNRVSIKKPNGTRDQPRIFTKRITSLVIAIGIFSYHSMTYDQLLPIFFEDKPANLFVAGATGFMGFQSCGGLGLSVQQVGIIMSVDGLIALVVQAGVFPFVAAYFGIRRIFLVASLFHPVTFLMTSFLVYLPPRWLSIAIYLCLTVRNLLSIIAFSALLILLKEATPSTKVLGKVNGLAASVGSACRTVAPPVAGYLYSQGSDLNFGPLAWYVSAFIAEIGAIQAFVMRSQATQDHGGVWNIEEVSTLVNSSLNSSDDERDHESIYGTGCDSDTCTSEEIFQVRYHNYS